MWLNKCYTLIVLQCVRPSLILRVAGAKVRGEVGVGVPTRIEALILGFY